VLASLGVVAAAVLAQTRIGKYADPVAAILIGVLMLSSAISTPGYR
jgi:Co/Zn/Cd efflux system component